MSHFVCDVGTTYYPFGRGGKANLVAAMREVQTNMQAINPAKIQSFSKLVSKIEADCPYLEVPVISPDADERPEKVRAAVLPVARALLEELLRLQVEAQLVSPQADKQTADRQTPAECYLASC